MSSSKSESKLKIDPNLFRKNLLQWYKANKRQLPWRYNQDEMADPYKVWMSEIMLQQTVVKTVIPYFNKFIDRWPTVHDLAASPQEDIIDAWAGLGYYSRARNLHKCAQQIVQDHNGVFPKEEKELLKLAGIGAYTAAAIRSIAYNMPANIIDGNVERVISRVFMLQTPIKQNKSEIKDKASQFIGSFEGNHSDYAQSLMELGAKICIPKTPRCEQCPVSDMCHSFKNNKQLDIPTPLPKIEKPHKHGAVYVIQNYKGEYLVERREEKGLLANMIGLPTSKWVKGNSKYEHENIYTLYNFQHIDEKVNHVFTHFTLQLTVYTAKAPEASSNQYFWITEDNLQSKLPSVFQKVYDLAKAQDS